jgi:hypothetical protein
MVVNEQNFVLFNYFRIITCAKKNSCCVVMENKDCSMENDN